MFFKKINTPQGYHLKFLGLKIYSVKNYSPRNKKKSYLGIFKKEKSLFGKSFYLFGLQIYSQIYFNKIAETVNVTQQNEINKQAIPSMLRALFDISKCPKATGKLRKKQEVNLYLLKEFAKLCHENDLHYWLRGGTLLGAVRHKGFIPWDDDSDVGMLRKDFEKLCQILENNPTFKMSWLYVKGDYHRIAHFGFKKNVYPFIDVMTFDTCAGTNTLLNWENWLKEKESFNKTIEPLVKNNDKKGYYLTADTHLRENPLLEQVLDNAVHDFKRKNNGQESLIWCIDQFIPPKNRGPIRCYPKEWIFPLKTLEFEGENFSVPNRYAEKLTLYYGDYLSWPKEIVYDSHFWAKEYIDNENEIDALWQKNCAVKYKNGYTCGVFDLFHTGHLNILKQAKQKCEFLTVAVSTDELVRKIKNKKTDNERNRQVFTG